jgi:hypothetical protein
MRLGTIFESILRARAAVLCSISATLTLLAIYETAHLVVQHADPIPLVLVGGLTVTLAFQTRRWYRRSLGQNPSARGEEQTTPRAPTA